MVFDFVEDFQTTRKFDKVGVESREKEDLGIDETPSFIDWASEPVAESINEKIDSIIGLIIDKQQFAFNEEDLPEDVGDTGTEFKGQRHGGEEIVLFEQFDDENVEEVRAVLGSDDVCDALLFELVGVGQEVGLVVAVVNIVHDFHEVAWDLFRFFVEGPFGHRVNRTLVTCLLLIRTIFFRNFLHVAGHQVVQSLVEGQRRCGYIVLLMEWDIHQQSV